MLVLLRQSVFAPERFIVVQANLLAAIEQNLQQLQV
jgi:hypothetical protein